MNTGLDQSVDLKQYWRVLRRRIGIIVLCVVVTLTASITGLAFVPREYESKVTLLITERQPLAKELETVMGGMSQPDRRQGIDAERMAKMAGRIRGRPFLERVVRLLQMEQDPAVVAAAAERSRKHPAVSTDEMTIRMIVDGLKPRIRFGQAGSGVYQIIVADYSPTNAQTLARWISELYVETSGQSSLDYLRATHEFGAEQLRIYEDQLRRSEEVLANYRGTTIGQQLSQGMVVGVANVGVAEGLQQQALDAAMMARLRLKEATDEAARIGGGDGGSITKNPEIQDQVAGLISVLKDEATNRIASGNSGSWPPEGAYTGRRRQVFRSIDERVASIHAESTTDARTALARIGYAEIDLQAHVGVVDFLRGAIAGAKQHAQSEPVGQIEVARLQATVETNRKLLQSFQAQMVASDVSQAMETTKLGSQMEILDPAQLPLTPVRPNRKKILLAALVLGPVIGVGMAMIAEALDSTLRSLEDFERVAPEGTLGTTPLLARSAVRPAGRIRRYWVPATLAATVVLLTALYLSRDMILRSFESTARPVQIVNPNG